MLDHLDSLIDRSLRVPGFKADDLGRAADQFSGLVRVLEELPHDNCDGQDLFTFASILHDSFLPYNHFRLLEPWPPKSPEPEASKAHPSCRGSCFLSEAVQAPKFINFRAGSHLPVERIEQSGSMGPAVMHPPA